MAGGGGAAVDHNGIYSNPNLHSLQQPHMEAESADSRKRPLETPAEEAGCTKRTNVGGKRETQRRESSSSTHMEANVVLWEPRACTGGSGAASHCMQHLWAAAPAPVRLAL